CSMVQAVRRRSARSSLPAPARSADATGGEPAVNLTVSPQIRLVAIVGLIAALGLGASMFMLGGHSSKTNTQSATTTVARRHAPPTKPTTTPATSHVPKPQTSTKPRTATKHVAKTAHRHAA